MKQPGRRPTAFKKLTEKLGTINPTGYLKVFVPGDAAIYRVTAISETIEDHYVATLEERPCWRSKQAPPPAPPALWFMPRGFCGVSAPVVLFEDRLSSSRLGAIINIGQATKNGQIEILYTVSHDDTRLMATKSFNEASECYDQLIGRLAAEHP